MTTEAGTYVTLTVGGGPSAAKVPDLREPHPEGTTPTLIDGPGTPNDQGPAGRNVEQRPSTGTEVESDNPTGNNAEEPGSDQSLVPALFETHAQEGFASYDYAYWLEESWQYDAQ